MTSNYLSNLWELWSNSIIEPAHVIKALAFYGYELGALTKGGIVANTATERFEYKHKTRA